MEISNVKGFNANTIDPTLAAQTPPGQKSNGEVQELKPFKTNGPGLGEQKARQEPQSREPAPVTVEPTGTRMRIDKESKRIITQIVDQSNQVIKQIPPQELLQIAARFRQLEGVIFDKKA